MKKITSLKKLICIMLLPILVFGLASCGGTKTGDNKDTAKNTSSDWEYIKSNGKLVIGYTVYDPMNYFEGNEFVGFDTEFAKAVCEKLGIEPDFVEINWDTKETELKAKSIDCIWNGFTINEERKKNLEFTKPYIENKQVVVVKKANADKYKDTASLSGANIVAETSSAGEDAIKDDENLSKATYTAVPKQTDGLLEVKSGTADAVVLDYTLANAMVGDGTDYADLTIVDGLDLAVEDYGIGFRKGSDMAEKVNGVIDELLQDGTLQKIAEKYELSAILIK